MTRQRSQSIPIDAVRAACRRVDAAKNNGASPEEIRLLAESEYAKLITEPICNSCRTPFDASGFVGFETLNGIVHIHNTKACRAVWKNKQY